MYPSTHKYWLYCINTPTGTFDKPMDQSLAWSLLAFNKRTCVSLCLASSHYHRSCFSSGEWFVAMLIFTALALPLHHWKNNAEKMAVRLQMEIVHRSRQLFHFSRDTHFLSHSHSVSVIHFSSPSFHPSSTNFAAHCPIVCSPSLSPCCLFWTLHISSTKRGMLVIFPPYPFHCPGQTSPHHHH